MYVKIYGITEGDTVWEKMVVFKLNAKVNN
jgi:hypothetical protein